MPTYTLAQVRETDIGAMSRIHALSFDDVWSASTIRSILQERGTSGVTARLDHRWTICGFAMLRIVTDECELLSIAVAPEHRNAGVGTFLLRNVIRLVGASGVRRLFLEVAEDNHVARQLYRAHGLRPVGRRPQYYRRPDGNRIDAVTMAHDLVSPSARDDDVQMARQVLRTTSL